MAKEKKELMKKVKAMEDEGLNEEEITDSLREEDYSNMDINDAMNQTKINKASSEEFPDLEVPTPSDVYGDSADIGFSRPSFSHSNFMQEPSTGRVEEIAEAVVQEKWDELVSSLGNINVWKEQINKDIISIKQELIRTQGRFENLEKAVLGKVNEYNKGLTNVSTDIKAMEKVFERILDPLTTNIKELSRITKELKGRK